MGVASATMLPEIMGKTRSEKCGAQYSACGSSDPLKTAKLPRLSANGTEKNAPADREPPVHFGAGPGPRAAGAGPVQGDPRARLRGRGLPLRADRRPAGGEPDGVGQLERARPPGDRAARHRAKTRAAGAVHALRPA